MALNTLLRGVRVLDLSQLVPGPFCTQYLAHLGAEVIKIEDPTGDPMRFMSPDTFAQINRGKKSITLNLRDETDRQRLKKLVAKADVLVESFKPGVMDKLGCGYTGLRQINPRLIYASLTGYGQTGPLRDHPGHDLNFRAYAGELEQTGVAGGAPTQGNLQTAGLGGALHAVIGILAALMGGRASGESTYIDVAMLDVTAALTVFPLTAVRSDGAARPRGADAGSGLLPNYGVYECSDGRHMALAALEPKFWSQFCTLVGRPEWATKTPIPGPKGEALRSDLTRLFKSKTRDEWTALLAGSGCCVSPVLRPEEMLGHEQILARGLVETVAGKPAIAFPIQFSNGLRYSGEPPELGQHNAELLA
jgi:crotonobetainyl-CoA:carnitine CoA-transferase CaiB-like acyl-CoA transferase